MNKLFLVLIAFFLIFACDSDPVDLEDPYSEDILTKIAFRHYQTGNPHNPISLSPLHL